MAKNNQKCVRMSDEILDIVIACPGDGFNDKFESLVIDYKKTISQREERLKFLDVKISDKVKDLQTIEDRINALRNLEFNLDSLRRDVLKINNSAMKIIDVSQIIATTPGITGANEIQTKKLKKCIS